VTGNRSGGERRQPASALSAVSQSVEGHARVQDAFGFEGDVATPELEETGAAMAKLANGPVPGV
jgi:hypothetical protein